MPLPGTITTATDPVRLQHGLVYRDDALVNSAATHVLIIGVGAYQAPELAAPLKTTILSAREVADWFMADGKARFSNANQKLGSVAVVLSETTEPSGKAPADYAGGPVPRATRDNTATVVGAWVDRINSHKENLAILYVASHGASVRSRTAFLLEDYGTRRNNATHGMAEVEQFIGALEVAKPVHQLLFFDCCRTPTDMQLPWEEDRLDKLISLQRDPRDHGEQRKQWTICSTALGEYAEGLADGRTLFNMALLESLNGVAGDTSVDGWPVRPGVLFDKIDYILRLHRLPDAKTQMPAGRMQGSFEITFPGESTDVPVYISLDDTAEWAGMKIDLKIDGAAKPPIFGVRGQSPFYLQRMPERAAVEATAERDSVRFGQITTKVKIPATFLKIPKGPPAPAVPRAGGGSAIDIVVSGPMAIDKGAIAVIAGRSKTATLHQEVMVNLADERIPAPPTTIALATGDYTVTVRLPDGTTQMRDFTLNADERLPLKFAAAQSPREWVAPAAIAGSISRDPAPGPASDRAGVRRTRSAVRAHAVRISTEVVGGLSSELELRPGDQAQVTLGKERSDERFERYEVLDARSSRYLEGPARFITFQGERMSAWVPPVFARIAASDGRQELAVLPSVGADRKYTIGGWKPALVIDRHAPANELMTTVVVEDRHWAALLNFVGSRDFAAGDRLFGDNMSQQAEAALRDKVSNPLAAVAGALVAVANSSPDVDKTWDPWLVNLTNWFHEIPDGPIILARRRMMRARTDEQVKEARDWFIKGFDRGVPIYSLSVDWLARGLENLPGDDAELEKRRRAARALANRVDSGRAFTVIRIKG